MMGMPPFVIKCIKDTVTGIDGESYDIARVLGVIGVLFFMGMACVNVFVKGQTFDYVNFGIGFGSMMGSVGVAIKLKERSEPQGGP